MIFTQKTLIRLLSLMLCGILLLGCVIACDQGNDPAGTETGTQSYPSEEESTSASTEAETEGDSTSDTSEETSNAPADGETQSPEPPAEEPEPFASDFYAGYAITDITPNTSAPLAGYGNSPARMSKFVAHPIYATCIAIKSGDDIALIYNLDVILADTDFVGYVQDRVYKIAGIPAENILINCSHTHSAPELAHSAHPTISAWRAILLTQMCNLATNAIADLDRSEVYTGSTHVEGMNFVRRYILKDGTHKTNASSGDGIVGHETEADNELQIILFKRQTKQQIALVNWRAHPCMVGNLPVISGDYISSFRSQMEEEGFLFAFHQGAAGNVNTYSAISDECTSKHYHHYTWYSGVLTNAILETIPKLKLTNTDGFYAGTQTLTMKISHDTDHLADKAQEILDAFRDTFNPNATEDGNALCVKYGISSKHAASAIVARTQMGDSHEISVYALSFGDIAFATAPFEIFQETGRYIKENSPFEMTFVSECTNGYYGYLPAAHAFPYGSYEVDTCRYVQGSAEQLAEALLDLLKEQAAAREAD